MTDNDSSNQPPKGDNSKSIDAEGSPSGPGPGTGKSDADPTKATAERGSPEQPVEPAKKEPIDKTTSKKTTGDKTAPKKPGVTRTLVWLLVLVVIALPIAGGLGAWLVWEQVQQQRSQLGELNRQLLEQEQALENQGQALENQSQTLAQLPDGRQLERDLRRSLEQAGRQQTDTLEQMEQRLNRVNRRLSAIASTDRQDWKLAEAEYLLRVANQRLVLERDSRNALALAQTADHILRDLDDSDLLPVRRALTRDIQALRLAGRIDREGLYLQLLALGELLPQLPLVEPLDGRLEEADTLELDVEATDPTVWQRIKSSFSGVLGRLSDHIRIRRHDEPLSALADPREQFYLRQQLQLMLEQAQAGLLREEPEIYRTSLTRAADWLEQHYRLNPQTQEALASLRELAQVDVAPELPDLNEALNLLERHIEQLQRLSSDFQRPRDGGRGESEE